MRSSTLFIPTLLLLMLGCNGPGHRSPAPDAGTVQYQNARFSFSVTLPSAWTFDESENGDGIRVHVPGYPDVRISIYGSNNVWGIRDLELLQRQFEELDPGLRGSAARIHVGGLQAIEWSTKDGDALAKHRVLLQGDRVYGLYLKAPAPAWPRALEAFEQVCHTFTLDV